MGILSTLLTAAVAAQAVLASPISARSPYTVKETHYAPREWTKLERANSDSVIELQIGLKQGNFDELERHLYEGKTLPRHSHNMFLCCTTSVQRPPLAWHSSCNQE